MIYCSTGLAMAYRDKANEYILARYTRPKVACTVCYASYWRSRCCQLNISSRLSLPTAISLAGVPDAAAVDQQYCCRTSVRHGWREPYGQQTTLPNVHPGINRKVTKSPSTVLTWVHTNTWNHPPCQVRAYSLGPTY